ncbi:MAG: carboxypeptidase-like regulatory domain-containing protein [Bacteroidales bacterium]|nr:carboxypeptidase-like regulatory domain-containing protein [Bacteroidales bacterium]
MPKYDYHHFVLLLLILILPFKAMAQNGDNLNLIDLSYKKETLKTILDDISLQSGLHFVYNTEQINDQIKIDIRVHKKDVDYVMNKISEILDFTYIKIEKQIILKPRKEEISTPKDNFKTLTVSGYVRDEKSHEVLIGATVSIEGKNVGTSTNAYGYYTLPLKRGVYTLVFSYLGYKREYVSINLDGNVKIDKYLENTETYHEAISIHGEDKNTDVKETLTRSTSSINVKDFSQYSGLVLGSDLVGILATDHGITRLSDGSAFYSVRGGGKDQNLILIDEAPIYHPSHLFGFYSSVSGDAINAIEVFTSDFPLKYGGRLSSITDIRTRDGSLGKFQFSGEITPFTVSGMFEIPINKEKITSTINYRKSILRMFQGLINREGDNNFYDVNAKIHLKISDKNRLYLSYYASKDDYNDLETGFNYAVDWRNIAATIRDYHVISNKIFMNNSAYIGQYNYWIFTNNEHSNYWTTSIRNLSFKTDFVHNLLPNITLRYGGEYSFHFFTPARLYTDNKKSNSGLLTGNADNIISYLGAETKINDAVSFKIGARFNLWDNYGKAKSYYYSDRTMTWDTISYPKGRFNYFVRIEPRAAIVLRASSNLSFKISAERNFQFLHTLSNSISPFTTLDLWVPSGNYFQPQSADNLTIDAMLRLRDIYLTFCTYYKYSNNLTEYKLHANMLLNQTIENEFYLSRSESYGFEIAAEKKTGKLNIKTFYSYSHSRRFTPELYKKKYISDNNIPHTLHIMVGYSFNKHITLKADWNFNTGIPYTKPVGFYYYEDYKIPYYGDRNNARLPNYHKMNVALEWHLQSLSHKIMKNFSHSLTFSVYNVYNRTNFVMVSYNKIKTASGEYVVPSNYMKDNQFVATGLSLPGIMPFISYKLKW